jgi:chloramphenicol-sensitive protein RarD
MTMSTGLASGFLIETVSPYVRRQDSTKVKATFPLTTLMLLSYLGHGLPPSSAMNILVLANSVAGGMSWETWVVALGYTVYFLLRRWLQTDTLAGHWIDMALLVPVAVGFTLRVPGSWPLLAGHPSLWALLPLLGIVSAVALALYMIASRWLPLGLFGLLSYVEPVLLVVVAWLLGESMEPQQQLSYALIFAAVGLLIGDGLRHSWRGRSHTSD